MSSFVVDASVAVKWFIKEREHEFALRLLEQDVTLIAPQLLLTEVANALCKRSYRGEFSRAEVERALTELPTLAPQLHNVGHFLPEAVRQAIVHRHPVYDFLYLLLATENNARMMTADQRFQTRLQGTSLADSVLLLSDWRPE